MKHLRIAAALALSLVAGQAAAQKQAPAPASAKGFYVEGTVGRSTFDIANTTGWAVSNRDTNYGLMLGYDFNENVALEGGYRYLGEATAKGTGNFTGKVYGRTFTGTGNLTASGDSRGWMIGPRFNLPVNDKFSLYGRVGMYRWDADLKVGLSAAYTWDGGTYAANTTTSKTFSKTDPYWGVGGTYQFTPQVAGGLGLSTWRHSGDLDITVRSVELNVKVRF